MKLGKVEVMVYKQTNKQTEEEYTRQEESQQ